METLRFFLAMQLPSFTALLVFLLTASALGFNLGLFCRSLRSGKDLQ
jgi:hypothetical protein